MNKTLFLLDSGDPNEFREISELAKKNDSEIWGATTNPSLIAKKLAGQKVTQDEAFRLQKQIVLEITNIVPGAVSAEVYADETTTAKEMIKQGSIIATWHKNVVVKLPTTIEGFKARTQLRKEKIPVNNTLVFSQAQMFAICLHEQIMQEQFGPINNLWPPFISPFVGRLDDIGENGIELVENGMRIKRIVNYPLWMLEASVRKPEHVKAGIKLNTELITAPAKVYREWFSLTNQQKEALDLSSYSKNLKPVDIWSIPEEFLMVDTTNKFMELIETKKLNIQHDLTDKGLDLFAKDWQSIIKPV